MGFDYPGRGDARVTMGAILRYARRLGGLRLSHEDAQAELLMVAKEQVDGGVSVLSVGEELDVLVRRHIVRNVWEVSSPRIDEGWATQLRSRSRALDIGDGARCWIVAVDDFGRRLFLANSEWGRFPVSDRMKPRYLAALSAMIRAISSGNGSDLSPEAISEVKGIINRCIRKDQPDWLTVYRFLGFPDRDDMRRAVDDLIALRTAILSGSVAEVGTCLRRLHDGPIDQKLIQAFENLCAAATRIGSARSAGEVRNVGSRVSPVSMDRIGIAHLSGVARTKLERANSSHRSTLELLVEVLGQRGGCGVEQ